MALNAADVQVAVTGAVHFGPAGTALPADTTTALAAGYLDAGYINSDGVTRQHSTSTNDIQAWQNSDVIRTVVTKDTVDYKFVMLETNDVSQQIYYGATPDAQGTVSGKSGQGLRGVWVIDTVDGTALDRIVIPDGQVTAWDDVKYSGGDAVMYGVTVTCYPDANGNKDYKYRGTAV